MALTNGLRRITRPVERAPTPVLNDYYGIGSFEFDDVSKACQNAWKEDIDVICA